MGRCSTADHSGEPARLPRFKSSAWTWSCGSSARLAKCVTQKAAAASATRLAMPPWPCRVATAVSAWERAALAASRRHSSRAARVAPSAPAKTAEKSLGALNVMSRPMTWPSPAPRVNGAPVMG